VDRLLFLGVGTIARAVQRALPTLPAAGTTRAAPDQRFRKIRPLAASDVTAIRTAAQGANVVVSFPPDGHSDRAWSTLVTGAASIAYLSSTAVYSAKAELVTEVSAVSASAERAALRLDAEQLWRDAGASIVRLPAFYGVSTGLHVSIARGTFRMPGSGNNVVSRVHEDDAARFVCAALGAAPGSLLLAGDNEPSPVAEVVRFVCALFGLPLPSTSEGEQIPLSLRASRSIDNSATKAAHRIQLAYPSYREGYQAICRAAVNSPGRY
jgi:nucleoside-diphosphate-sugar epimerase